jgi:hypothetical protein
MKVIEQVISPKGVKTEVISVGKKKYKRVSWKSVHRLIGDVERIEWRRFKTNHLTKKVQQDELESQYSKKFPNRTSPDPYFGEHNMISSGSTILHQFVSVQDSLKTQGIIEDDKERRRIERGLVKVSNNGLSKLSGVKYVKNETGWGLKESKDFVDNFFSQRNTNLMSGL